MHESSIFEVRVLQDAIQMALRTMKRVSRKALESDQEHGSEKRDLWAGLGFPAPFLRGRAGGGV